MFPSTVASSSCENKSSASSSAGSGEGNLCHFVLELFPVKKCISSSYRTTIMSVNCFLRLPKSDSAREFGGQQSSGCHFSQATGLEDRSTGLVGLDTGKTCPSSYLKQFHLSTFLNFLTVYTMDTLMRQCSQRQETRDRDMIFDNITSRKNSDTVERYFRRNTFSDLLTCCITRHKA